MAKHVEARLAFRHPEPNTYPVTVWNHYSFYVSETSVELLLAYIPHLYPELKVVSSISILKPLLIGCLSLNREEMERSAKKVAKFSSKPKALSSDLLQKFRPNTSAMIAHGIQFVLNPLGGALAVSWINPLDMRSMHVVEQGTEAPRMEDSPNILEVEGLPLANFLSTPSDLAHLYLDLLSSLPEASEENMRLSLAD